MTRTRPAFHSRFFRLVLSLSVVIPSLGLFACGEDTVTRRVTIPPVFVLAWGENGTGPGQFNQPKGIALDAAGNVYVADGYNNRIQKFDDQGRFLAAWGTAGNGDGQFANPWAIAVDPGGNVFVTDRNNHRIQEFDSQGRYLEQWGTWGLTNGTFSHPRGIAVDSHGGLYVQEGLIATDNNRIQKFNGAGQFLLAWGSFGHEAGQFDFTAVNGEAPRRQTVAASRPLGTGPLGGIRGVAVDRSDRVYVADTNNHRVQVFSTTGVLLRSLGRHGDGPGEFEYPQGIAADREGRVYVDDGGPARRIQILGANGAFLTAWGSPGTGDGQFGQQLGGIAVDDGGNIYVVDSSNSRIQKFRYPPAGPWTVASP